MVFLNIVLFILIIILLTRLILLKRELHSITKQVRAYNTRKTNKKIDIVLLDQSLEKLSMEINQLIDLYVAENQKRVRFEKEHRQAVANMSHDLRTPLTSIIGYIQMAQTEGIAKDEKNELLSIAMEKAKRLETLLNDFFELSIIESPDYELKWEKVNLTQLATNVLMSFYDQFQNKGFEPKIQLPNKEVSIRGDASAVSRVMENVLSNALKHADGNIIICLEENDEQVMFFVKNDAHSLKEEDVPQLFNRFFMADMARSGKSTGLGLSIVKSLMEKMKGTLEVHLQNGQFSITCKWKR